MRPQVERRPNLEMEQALACLQVDVLHCKYRLLLALGVEHSQRGAAGRQATNASTRLKRTREQTIYGAKSRKQLREEEEGAERDRGRPLLPPKQWERDLVNGCNKNCYERAIVLIEMARLPRLSDERQRILQEAMSAIAEAEASEARIEDQVSSPPSLERTAKPNPPRLVMRSATAMILSADPWRQPKGGASKDVAGYALYCKNEGSGVAVSLNNVEFRGTGITRRQGEKIIVHGLVPNESYVFALSPMDPRGKVIGGIGETSVPVVALLPMPTLLLWGHVSLSASQMKLGQLTRSSGLRLYSHFVAEGPRRSLWQQNPMDRDMLRVDRIQRAPQALLRVFCQVLVGLTDLVENETLNGEAPDTWMVPEDFTDVDLKSHLLRLRTSKKLLMAVFVAAGIDDEQLCCKVGLRAYNLLLPLLQLRRTPSMLLQAYSVIHSSVRVFLKAAEAAGGEKAARGVKHPDVRRVLCCLSKAMVGVARDADEPDLLRAVLDAEFDDQEAILAGDAAMEAAARQEAAGEDAPPPEAPADATAGASEEQRAMWEYLLSLPELQEKAKGYGGALKGCATAVLPLLKGSPGDAWAALDKDDPRALEFAARIVEEAIAENQGEAAMEWVKEMEDRCKGAASEVVTTDPVAPTGVPLPSVDPPQEELDEEKADVELVAKDGAERKDLEIQFINPTQSQLDRWAENKAAVEERRVAREESAKARVEARREECCRRIQLAILPKVRRAKETRAKRDLIKRFGPGLAALKYLAATHRYSHVLAMDLSNPDNHPEPEPDEAGPPPPEPAPEADATGVGEEGEKRISLRPLEFDDPAYRPPVLVPGVLRHPLRALKSLVQGSRVACRSKLWTLMLNTVYQACNLVDEYFSATDQDRAFASSGLRGLAEDVLDCLEYIKAVAENRPPPTVRPPSLPLVPMRVVQLFYVRKKGIFAHPFLLTLSPLFVQATLTEMRLHTATKHGEAAAFKFNDGIMYRMVDGNKCTHDRYDPVKVSNLMVTALKSLLAGGRNVAVLAVVERLHKLTAEDTTLTEKVVPIMLEATEFVMTRRSERNQIRGELGLMMTKMDRMNKELATGGRLAEGLRTRAKERAAMMIEQGRLQASIDEANKRLKQIRFEAIDELPGSGISTSKLHEEWVLLRKNIARDKSKAKEQLDGCRAMIKDILNRGVVASSLPPSEPEGEKEGGGEGAGGAEEDQTRAEEGEVGGEDRGKGEEGGGEAAGDGGGGLVTRAPTVAKSEVEKEEHELLPGGVMRLEVLGVAGEYARCISTLREKREKVLLPLALAEYGHVLRLLGDIKGAANAWGDAMDSVFTVMHVGRHWRDVVPVSIMLRGENPVSSEHLIKQFGAWGIITAGTLSAALARYGHPMDLHQQLELSLLCAHLFAVPFSSGLPHPQRAAEFAGYTPRELITGFDPTSDTLR